MKRETVTGGPSGRRGLLLGRRLLLVALSLAAGLLAAELAVRLLGRAPAVRPIVVSEADSVYRLSDNPVLGFELKPGYRDEDADLLRSYPSTNSHGQRDVERRVEKSPGVRRVILLGDSVVEGIRIRDLDETLSRRLEALYPGGEVEVLNFGVSGYCTRAEVELLETRGLRFRPDDVILLFTWNDFDDFNQVAFSLSRPRERPGMVKSLFRRSALFRLLSLRFDLWGFAAETQPLADNERAIGEGNVQEGLARLAELADEHGFRVVVAIWPLFEDEGLVDPHPMPDGSGDLVVERLSRMHGLPSARLSDLLRRWLPEGANARLRWTIDGDHLHPNSEATVLGARALKEILEDLSAGRLARCTPSPDPEALIAAAGIGGREPDPSLVPLGEGVSLLRQGRSEEAERAFRRALELRPDSPEARMNLGVLLQSRGDLVGALEHYDAGLATEPDHTNLHHNRALALAQSGRRVEAEAAFRRALEIDPSFLPSLTHLGRLLRREGRSVEAEELLRRALSLRPSAPLHISLGNALRVQGRPEEAAAEYRRSLEIDGAIAEAHHNLGLALSDIGRSEEALDALERAVELAPDRALFHVSVGLALGRSGGHAEAAESFARAASLEPGQAEIQLLLGLALLQTGRMEKAREHLRLAARLEPAIVERISARAWSYATRPQAEPRAPDFALLLAGVAIEAAGPQAWTLLDVLGASLAAAGRFDEAVVRATEALARAEKLGHPLAPEIRERITMYREGRPYRVEESGP